MPREIVWIYNGRTLTAFPECLEANPLESRCTHRLILMKQFEVFYVLNRPLNPYHGLMISDAMIPPTIAPKDTTVTTAAANRPDTL